MPPLAPEDSPPPWPYPVGLVLMAAAPVLVALAGAVPLDGVVVTTADIELDGVELLLGVEELLLGVEALLLGVEELLGVALSSMLKIWLDTSSPPFTH